MTLSADLIGKKILITSGRPREDIDGVRHYANPSRPEYHGYSVAEHLAELGAEVTVIGPMCYLPPPINCRLIHVRPDNSALLSGRDVMETARQEIALGDYDAALCFASISALAPTQRSAQKIKSENGPEALVAFNVIGNIDVKKEALSWGLPVWGYTTRQEVFASSPLPAWLDAAAAGILATPPALHEELPTDAGDRFFSFSEETSILAKRTVIVTSGPTQETVTATGDVITNFSSGRQGQALALAFAREGASVTYVVGTARFCSPKHERVKVVKTTSALSMLEACQACLPVDVFVGVAAVTDFGCPTPPDLALAEGEAFTLMLSQNPDILREIGHAAKRPRLVVGFAAKPDPDVILAYAEGKLAEKKADLICANLIARNPEHSRSLNEMIFVSNDSPPRRLPVLSKDKTATAIVNECVKRLARCARPKPVARKKPLIKAIPD